MAMNTNFTKWFLHPDGESEKTYRLLMDEVVTLINEQVKKANKPFSGAKRTKIAEKVQETINIPVAGQEMETVMGEIRNVIVGDSLWISHPSAMAHLHCPPLLPSLAAESIITALNQSMDSWDQSPSATYVEEALVEFFTKKIGYSHEADGVFTSGGTQSNYMGLLLARNKACETYFLVNAHKEGLPFEARKLRIICSEHAHFTVQQSAAQLGLGTNAVVTVSTDDEQKFSIDDAREKLKKLRQEGFIPFMMVATAGTTDFGSIDCISEMAQLASEEGLWLHVDAAYGGALLFSHQYRSLIDGLQMADSITIDFHKLYYQSISCGAFFVKNKQDFHRIAYYADYLNPEEDQEEGIINLVEKSVQTTKRFDALKLWMTFKLMGTDLFGKMIDYTIDLAKETACLMNSDPYFEVLANPEINAVLFRYIPFQRKEDREYVDKINLKMQRAFYENGELIMAKTKQNGEVYLKFTMLNPLNTIGNMKEHIERMKQMGEKIEKEQGGTRYEYSIHY
jgi:L-2,4-diaminobutyrate decarboxylase